MLSACASGVLKFRVSHNLTVSSPPRVARFFPSREKTNPDVSDCLTCPATDAAGRLNGPFAPQRQSIPSVEAAPIHFPSGLYVQAVTFVRCDGPRTTNTVLCSHLLFTSHIRTVESAPPVIN